MKKNNQSTTVILIFGFVLLVIGMGLEGTLSLVLIGVSIVLFVVSLITGLVG